MPEDILTVPAETKYRLLLVTGNEYLALPEINPRDGGIRSLNVLHMGAAGLLAFTGAKGPLIVPFLNLNGRNIHLKFCWSYRHAWLPRFKSKIGEILVEGTIFAPPGHRGAVYLLQFTHHGAYAVSFAAGFDVAWGDVRHHIFKAKKVRGEHEISFDGWTNSLVLEARSGVPLAALALGLGNNGEWRLSKNELGCARGMQALRLQPGEKAALPLYMSVNLEGSGAGATVVDLRRRGFAALLTETEAWFQARKLKLVQHGAAANRNLFFNYFFALGRALDTDAWVPVTSRSPRYYVSAAFWSRDCLLWSFPGLLLVDGETARQVLLAVYGRHLERAGEHAHYINGVLLYPGFELDQLAAYVLALEAYLLSSGDASILREKVIKEGLAVLAAKLLAQRDRKTGLYGTFLDPSDDPVKYPFLIYDNVLAQRALAFLAGLQQSKMWKYPADLARHATALRRAVFRWGVVEGPFGPMFAWCVDGRGRHELYDNPPGSLQLLAYYGFCQSRDAVYRNTVRWIHSRHNPYYCDRGPVRGVASRHAANPWPLAAANDLLSLNLDRGRFFSRAQMDNGFCCETVEQQKGRAATGQAFASAAGFLAFALYSVYGVRHSRREGKKK
ncbi:MAG: glycoside hydrolase family 125 protein [Bacillota bacterium]